MVVIKITKWTRWRLLLGVNAVLVKLFAYREREVLFHLLFCIKGEQHPKPKVQMFCLLSQISNTDLKSNVGILKQIVWETKKMHWDFRRPHSSWLVGQDVQVFVLISNLTTQPAKFLVPFLSFADNLLQDAYILFAKKVLIIMI